MADMTTTAGMALCLQLQADLLRVQIECGELKEYDLSWLPGGKKVARKDGKFAKKDGGDSAGGSTKSPADNAIASLSRDAKGLSTTEKKGFDATLKEAGSMAGKSTKQALNSLKAAAAKAVKTAKDHPVETAVGVALAVGLAYTGVALVASLNAAIGAEAAAIAEVSESLAVKEAGPLVEKFIEHAVAESKFLVDEGLVAAKDVMTRSEIVETMKGITDSQLAAVKIDLAKGTRVAMREMATYQAVVNVFNTARLAVVAGVSASFLSQKKDAEQAAKRLKEI